MQVEILKTGTFEDVNGNPRTFDRAALGKIAQEYDPRLHEAPVAIGPIMDTSPSYAWVESLRTQGNILFAQLKDVVPAFADMIRKQAFTKRSVTLYPSGGLRTVSFLGADPPRVPGLHNVQFSGNKGVCYEFSEGDLNGEKASDKLSILISRKMNENPELSYGQAFSEVQTENPELTWEYVEELNNLINKRRIT